MRFKSNIISSLFLSSIILMINGGCTQMDGNIGELFGRWNVVSIEADGENLPLYVKGANDDGVLLYTWAFQGDLIVILTLYPHQESHQSFGMWKSTDTQLLLDYSHTDDGSPLSYIPPAPLHLVENGVTPLNIQSLTSSDMSLWYVGEDNVKYEYHLKKAY